MGWITEGWFAEEEQMSGAVFICNAERLGVMKVEDVFPSTTQRYSGH